MAKSMDTKKTEKKEPLKTPKEKKAEKREKKANKKQFAYSNQITTFFDFIIPISVYLSIEFNS